MALTGQVARADGAVGVVPAVEVPIPGGEVGRERADGECAGAGVVAGVGKTFWTRIIWITRIARIFLFGDFVGCA